MRKGLTLIEVMLAIVVLAVGILAAVTLQASSLRATRRATEIKDISDVAQAALEAERTYDRYLNEVLEQVLGEDCSNRSFIEVNFPGYTCTVDVFPCLINGSTMDCTQSPIPGATINDQKNALVAHYLRVTVTAPNEAPVTLTTIIRTESKPFTGP